MRSHRGFCVMVPGWKMPWSLPPALGTLSRISLAISDTDISPTNLIVLVVPIDLKLTFSDTAILLRRAKNTITTYERDGAALALLVCFGL